MYSDRFCCDQMTAIDWNNEEPSKLGGSTGHRKKLVCFDAPKFFYVKPKWSRFLSETITVGSPSIKGPSSTWRKRSWPSSRTWKAIKAPVIRLLTYIHFPFGWISSSAAAWKKLLYRDRLCIGANKIALFLKMGHSQPLFLYFCLSYWNVQLVDKVLLMLGFKQPISGIVGNRSTNWAITTQK